MEVDHLPLAVDALPDLGAACFLHELAKRTEVGSEVQQVRHERHVTDDRDHVVAGDARGLSSLRDGSQHLPQLDDVVDAVVVALVQVVPDERHPWSHVLLEERVMTGLVGVDETAVQFPDLLFVGGARNVCH